MSIAGDVANALRIAALAVQDDAEHMAASEDIPTGCSMVETRLLGDLLTACYQLADLVDNSEPE